MPEPIWKPPADRIEKANMTAFLEMVARRYGPGVTDFASLYQWSIREPQEFWPAVWDFCGIVASRRGERVVDDPRRMPGAAWFPEARLNFAENLLRYRDEGEALVFWNEGGRRRSLSRAQLYDQVRRLAAALRSWGVEAGDRVAGYLPNVPETVVAMLAATSIGAAWSSCSPDFGLQGVFDRFGQIQPKVLFAAGGYQYAEKTYDCRERIQGIVERIPSIEKLVWVSYQGGEPAGIPNAVLFEDCLGLAGAGALQFEQLPFDHPVYVLYSSGTTGPPKCIVHGAGGTLIQHLKEHILHTNLKPGDRIVYFTTCGWMMWNWLVSSLASGATIILYDGSPFHPHPHILFDIAQRERLTVFGTSARFLAGAQKAGLEPGRTHDLSALRTIISTGSPLAPESFDFVYRSIKEDVHLASISGGTDIVSSFALGNPIAPVWRGELQTPGLGMNVQVFDEQGRAVRGKKGELVCVSAFPSMPRGFWNDDGGERYRRTYFDYYPGVWRHGDYAEYTEHGGMIIHGRSDAVLNPGGVRIGTAEIYRIVDQLPEVLESLVIGQDWQGDVRVVLFVKLKTGSVLDEKLIATIKQEIRKNASPRHVPSKVIAVADIPRTISGKITELAVREVVHNRPVRNTEALANPTALELFRDLEELGT